MKIPSSFTKLSLWGSLLGVGFFLSFPLFAAPIRPGYSIWQRPLRMFAESEDKIAIADQLKESQFKTLVSLLETTGLIEELALSGKCTEQKPCTFFAPTDQAFDQLSFRDIWQLATDQKRLKQVLEYHLITHEINAEKEIPGTIQTLANEPITITEGKNNTAEFWVNNRLKLAPTSEGNTPFIFVDNGVIIPVDQVLIPPSW